MALALSAGWIALGVVAYAVYTRLGANEQAGGPTGADETAPQTDD